MNPEDRQLLEENLKISKENNALLVKIHNIQRWSQITKIFYWVLIVGIAFGAFYFIKPMLGGVLNIYSGGVSGVKNVGEITKNLKDKQNISSLMELLGE